MKSFGCGLALFLLLTLSALGQSFTTVTGTVTDPTGGGAVHTPVYCDGTNWIAD